MWRDLVNRHGWQLLTAAAIGGFAWSAMRAEVNKKADKSATDRIEERLDRVDKKIDAVVLYLCYQKTHDLGCQRS